MRVERRRKSPTCGEPRRHWGSSSSGRESRSDRSRPGRPSRAAERWHRVGTCQDSTAPTQKPRQPSSCPDQPLLTFSALPWTTDYRAKTLLQLWPGPAVGAGLQTWKWSLRGQLKALKVAQGVKIEGGWALTPSQPPEWVILQHRFQSSILGNCILLFYVYTLGW